MDKLTKRGWLEGIKFKELSLTDLREFMYFVITECPAGGKFWDVITALRGPDSPSERGDQTPSEQAMNYDRRRARKYESGEIIRSAAFYGAIGGAARSHKGDTVVVNPGVAQDHYDRHVVRAATVLGLNVKVRS